MDRVALWLLVGSNVPEGVFATVNVDGQASGEHS